MQIRPYSRHQHILLIIVILLATSPVFALANTSGKDSYKNITETLSTISRTPHAKLVQIGQSVKHRPIYAVLLTDSPAHPSFERRNRILLICAQHGDEATSARAMLIWANRLANTSDSAALSLLKRSAIMLVPVANPDGFAANCRLNANGVDLNRDWDKRSQPETKAIDKLIRNFRPQAFVDEHEWLNTPRVKSNCVETPGFGRQGIMKKTRHMVLTAVRSTQSKGIALSPVFYRATSDSSLAHRHYVKRGICSMLVETSSNAPMNDRYRRYTEFVTALVGTLASDGHGIPMHQLVYALCRPDTDANSSYQTPMAKGNEQKEFDYFWFILLIPGAAILGYYATRKNSVRPGIAPYTLHRRPSFGVISLVDLAETDASMKLKLELFQTRRSRPCNRRKTSRSN